MLRKGGTDVETIRNLNNINDNVDEDNNDITTDHRRRNHHPKTKISSSPTTCTLPSPDIRALDDNNETSLSVAKAIRRYNHNHQHHRQH